MCVVEIYILILETLSLEEFGTVRDYQYALIIFDARLNFNRVGVNNIHKFLITNFNFR